MNKCPRCFCVLHDDQYAWSVAPVEGGDRYLDPVASAFVGADTASGPIYSVTRPVGYRGPLLSASDAATALAAPVVEICPVCHFTLPDGWRHCHAICIAMAGTPATGKSTYLAVSIKQMQLLCEGVGVSMEPASRVSADAYALNYEQPLYDLRGMVPPTPTLQTQVPNQRLPLIFSIGIRDGIRRFLVIRDVAGEDLETGDMQAPQFRYFTNADAVLFMFDPIRVKEIRDQLYDLLPAQSYSAGDARALLSNVLLAIGAGRPRLAVVLSKFDALRALGEVEGSEWSQIMSNAGAAYLRDNSAAHYYDDNDGELLHEEVRSLLLRLHARSLVTAIESHSTAMQLVYRYFAVSALGQPHTGDRVNSRGITPFRCTDPLRWITSSAGVL
jgi:Double-GTPase 2